jgi:hypothetical protein
MISAVTNRASISGIRQRASSAAPDLAVVLAPAVVATRIGGSADFQRSPPLRRGGQCRAFVVGRMRCWGLASSFSTSSTTRILDFRIIGVLT